MKDLCQPFQIRNTQDHGWVVTMPGAVQVHSSAGELIEDISITVSLPRRAELSIQEVHTFAMKRALELIQAAIAHRTTE